MDFYTSTTDHNTRVSQHLNPPPTAAPVAAPTLALAPPIWDSRAYQSGQHDFTAMGLVIPSPTCVQWIGRRFPVENSPFKYFSDHEDRRHANAALRAIKELSSGRQSDVGCLEEALAFLNRYVSDLEVFTRLQQLSTLVKTGSWVEHETTGRMLLLQLQHLRDQWDTGSHDAKLFCKLFDRLIGLVFTQLACASFQQRYLLTTLQLCANAVNLDPENGRAYFTAAIVNMQRKNYTGALGAFNHVLHYSAPSSDLYKQAMTHAVNCHLHLGNFHETKNLITQYAGHPDKPVVSESLIIAGAIALFCDPQASTTETLAQYSEKVEQTRPNQPTLRICGIFSAIHRGNRSQLEALVTAPLQHSDSIVEGRQTLLIATVMAHCYLRNERLPVRLVEQWKTRAGLTSHLVDAMVTAYTLHLQ